MFYSFDVNLCCKRDVLWSSSQISVDCLQASVGFGLTAQSQDTAQLVYDHTKLSSVLLLNQCPYIQIVG